MRHETRFYDLTSSARNSCSFAYLPGSIMAADNAFRELSPCLVGPRFHEMPGVSTYPTSALILLPLHCGHTKKISHLVHISNNTNRSVPATKFPVQN